MSTEPTAAKDVTVADIVGLHFPLTGSEEEQVRARVLNTDAHWDLLNGEEEPVDGVDLKMHKLGFTWFTREDVDENFPGDPDMNV